MDYDLIVVKTLERVYKNYYYIIRGEIYEKNYKYDMCSVIVWNIYGYDRRQCKCNRTGISSSRSCFPEEKVLQIENQIKNTPIYNDKDAEGNFSLKNTRATGTYPTRYGVILVTADKYKGLIPTGHAGIIWTSSTIVESLSN